MLEYKDMSCSKNKQNDQTLMDQLLANTCKIIKQQYNLLMVT